MTPYESVCGQCPSIVTTYPPGKVQSIDTMLQGRTTTLAALKDNLHMAQNHMKQQVDQHCSERVFQEGDQVFLRLQWSTLQKNISQIPRTSQVSMQVLWALPNHQAYWFGGLQIGPSNFFQNLSGVPCFFSEESGRTKL
jgi:hypothetical protein